VSRGLAIAARPFAPILVVVRAPDLRRSQLALLSFGLAEWATWISMLIYAFRIGGTVATGVVALVQLTPAALVAPFASSLGDRFRRQDVAVATYIAGSLLMAATAAALFTRAPLPLIYGLAAGVTTSVTLSRPTNAALVATVARSPEELIAANVTTGMIQSASVLI
jgi:hypothetical protein